MTITCPLQLTRGYKATSYSEDRLNKSEISFKLFILFLRKSLCYDLKLSVKFSDMFWQNNGDHPPLPCIWLFTNECFNLTKLEIC